MTAVTDNLPGQVRLDAHYVSARQVQTPAPANSAATPMIVPPGRDQTADSGQLGYDAQRAVAAVGADDAGQGLPARLGSAPRRQALADPALRLAGDVLDDLEAVRKANQQRLDVLTSTRPDYGHALDARHPDIARLASIVAALGVVERDAVQQLEEQMQRHPLGPWVKAQMGIGDKQAARLLAVIGDPYIRPEMEREDGTVEPARPRTVSELWAYCGYIPGQRRTKGQKANWSSLAKSRAYLIAESCCKLNGVPDRLGRARGLSPYRAVYDARKAATAERLHAAPCVRCGRKGRPAQPETPWSDGHRHADALRIVAKAILRDLWREARRIHLDDLPGHGDSDAQGAHARQVQAADSGQRRNDAQRALAAVGPDEETR